MLAADRMLSHEQAKVFYDRFGKKQDWQGFYENFAVADLIEHLALSRAHCVIEFGCGTGRFAESLLIHHLSADAQYLGVDLSSTMVALTQKRLGRFGARAKVLLTQGQTRLDVPSDSADRFLSIYVLDLLTEDDILSVIAEAHRILAPGGLLGLVSLTHGFTPLSRIVEQVWVSIHNFHPILVGGCRPISLKEFINDVWYIRHNQKLVRFGVPSEVLIAAKMNGSSGLNHKKQPHGGKMRPVMSLEELLPPCAAACPVGTDARRYVGLIFRGRYEEAMEVIKANNVIPSVCAYICAHPCEDACRRQYVEGPLAIRALKRFVMDGTREYRRHRYQRASLSRPQRVAIVGSGPAGLAAARDLLLAGYPVTLFERESEPGGMPMHAVPKFRLPKAVVWEDLKELEALGAEFRTGQAWGRDFSLEGLKERGYQAVLLAIGLQKARDLPVPGMDAAGVHLALPFLRQVAQGQTPRLGEKALIVGCGNVAMDAARAIKRLGVPEVLMICLEAPEQLFASPVETERTKEEVIDLIYQWAPKVVQTEGGRVQGVELMACTSLFDDVGRFAPTYDETRTLRLEADTVIFAIGQEAELEAAQDEKLAVAGGRIRVDGLTMATSLPGVYPEGLFLAGEIFTGPTLAIAAAASGRKAARAIDHFLRTGRHLTLTEECPRPNPRLPEKQASRICRVPSRPLKERPVAERLQDFDSAELVYEEAEALIEARRCLHCGRGAEVIDRKCVRCLTCVRCCPFLVPHMESQAVFPEVSCIACGFCASQCPAYAINIRRLKPRAIRQQITEVLRKGPREITFACLRGLTNRQALQTPDTVWWDCLKLLQHEDLLAPFELGATGLVLKECQADCRLQSAGDWFRRLVHRTNEMLVTIGLGKRVRFAPEGDNCGKGFQETS
jgi:NADPH-dependent glutamate synthase beta subunit-like oxidoreductase/ubiquinone/menaquinone biosynthesis C-methylase UbiE